jgi:hypothetical protein
MLSHGTANNMTRSKPIPISSTNSGWSLWAIALAVVLYAGLGGCTSPTETVADPFTTDIALFHYTDVLTRRYYVESPVPDTGVRDTVVDSLKRIFVGTDGVFWAESYRATRHFAGVDTLGQPIPSFDENATTRLVGQFADTLFLDPSTRNRLLVAPMAVSRSWLVDQGGAITAVILAAEVLPLSVGNLRSWHVSQGAVADEWYAPDLGRIQYEENDGVGGRVLGTLIAVDQF